MAKFDWYNDTSKEFLDRGYLNNKTIYQRIDDIANTVYHVYNDTEVRDKVKEYIELGYYVLPSPVWSNVGTGKAAGISCFNSYIEDSVKSILHTAAEVGMLCKIGGGTSAYFGNIRPAGSNISVGGTTYGSVHFMKIFDVIKNTISQGSTRRGEFAAYLDISHGDIEEFLSKKDILSKDFLLEYAYLMNG
jgi:ribonucleoside-diphosphate reductase alpha chain